MQNKVIPLRKCVACGKMKPKDELFRLVKTNEGISMDLSYKAQGRGAYICKQKACVDLALKKKSLNKSFRQAVKEEVFESIFMELENDK